MPRPLAAVLQLQHVSCLLVPYTLAGLRARKRTRRSSVTCRGSGRFCSFKKRPRVMSNGPVGWFLGPSVGPRLHAPFGAGFGLGVGRRKCIFQRPRTIPGHCSSNRGLDMWGCVRIRQDPSWTDWTALSEAILTRCTPSSPPESVLALTPTPPNLGPHPNLNPLPILRRTRPLKK